MHLWRTRDSKHARRINPEGKNLIDQGDDEDAHYALLQENLRRLKRWVTTLIVLLVLVAAALGLAIANASSQHTSRLDSQSPVPPIPSTHTTFNLNPLFAGRSSPSRDEAWSALLPPGDGFILLPNATAQGLHHLPLGKSTSRGQIYDISLFHQLHCLANIRAHLLTLQASMDRENRDEIFDLLLKPQEGHVWHCFDYIRQALMCAGDMTVEWPRTEEDGRRFAVDGWGVTHECKDWDAIMTFMKERTVANVDVW
ncbi:hypothetical protein LTR91_011583 [Friedmanniomyces endolithicus]|uniref:Oxidase ustYa n=1 Tax=Friedmanniomyces endolithicus TaxID=329885 RepID=A0AAN6FM26_9PEZI|nr:hypothetical protein LTR35_007641 [Friedmanniomyces endolithicus]KAK0295227.1 hypothetical protein LTS00_006285 [Friedmanniomyces endolithicus]KAK0313952.1 hypothetical protein LTR01_002210 [Friedmanniomyces endolithicus]KAK0318609.1 hypothetical protein LTR82_010351 [Friedmanniomyces endolithicus]KAK0831527.1 hypothetical protein LTR73_002910 [Friedmanniomyces endolithicus]